MSGWKEVENMGEHVTRMYAKRLVKSSRTIYLPEEDIQDAIQEYGVT